MSGQEARLRLSACRWFDEDRSDPFFAAALDQAATKPALAQWWTKQRALDDIFERTLLRVSVPKSLRNYHRKTKARIQVGARWTI